MKTYYKYVIETKDGKKFDSFESSNYSFLFTSLRECKNDAKEYQFALEYETNPKKKFKKVRFFTVTPKSKEVK